MRVYAVIVALIVCVVIGVVAGLAVRRCVPAHPSTTDQRADPRAAQLCIEVGRRYELGRSWLADAAKFNTAKGIVMALEPLKAICEQPR